MDLVRDLIESVKEKLISEGIQLDPNDDGVLLIARYNEFKMRRIAPASRRVHFSNALLVNPEYNRNLSAIQNLQRISETGGELTPYQSRTISKFRYQELLLFDWGIQHLHLGEHKPGAEFSDRTGPLLFTMVERDNLYFINILDHGSWALLELLDIIDVDWPHLIERFVMGGILDISFVPTPDETIELRKAGITAAQKLSSGKILMPPGGGITTAVTSARAMSEAQNLIRVVRGVEDWVNDNLTDVLSAMKIENTSSIRLMQISSTDKTVTVYSEESNRPLKIPLE